LRHQPQTQPDVSLVQPEQKPDAQQPGVDKPSPTTPAHKVKPETGRQPGPDESRFQASANRAQAQPAALRSDAPPSAGNAGSADNSVSVVQQVLPDVPQTASDTIHGTIAVSVRVKVDASGNVVGADLGSPGPSKYFARLSLEAAPRWKFAPSGNDAGRDFVLHFEFRSTGTRAFAARAGS
jgi:TonB family protein